MTDWQPLLQIVGMIVIPLATLMWVIHTSAKKDREAMRRDIEHVHDCVEKRATEQKDATHRLELRVVAIETRGHQVRRADIQKPEDRS